MTAITAPAKAELRDSDYWIRPWYPAGHVGHIQADCPELLRTESDPREGAGWLDPRKADVCADCLRRHNVDNPQPSWDAVCDTCHTSMADDWDDEPSPFTEDDAKNWRGEHQCEPSIRLIAPDNQPVRTAA